MLLRSFATLSEFLNHLFGTNISLPIYSFGLFVALAFLAAGYVLYIELKRKEQKGLFQPVKETVVVGRPATPLELGVNGLLGFVLGWKIGGVITDYAAFSQNPPQFIFSGNGNILTGILLGALLMFLKWREKNKQKLDKPKEKLIDVYPHHRVGDLIVLAAVFGLIGAKIFSNFEEENGWSSFWNDPLGNFFSGLTIYGGLILGAAAIIYYAWRKKINVLHLGDAVAPGLILAYAVGRIGCQVAGDGDWGILNSAYISTPETKIELAEPGDYEAALFENIGYYQQEFGDIKQVPHAEMKAPSWMPRVLVAQNYAFNVNDEGQTIENCDTGWCSQLPVPVYPTPLYETVMGLIIFGFLWAIRKRTAVPGMILAWYVLLAGVERYFIEKIRVNNVVTFMGINATQATFISIAFVTAGLIMMLVFKRMYQKKA